ncbi:MAG: hypothetical protein KKH01_00715 [Firmicutes bacterium]|nr:hypothetical protein [Bacillota bacterium]
MKKTNFVKNENEHRQFLMQELQIDAFAELSKFINEKIGKFFKHFSR